MSYPDPECLGAEPSIFKYAIMYVDIDDFMSLFQTFYASPETHSIAEQAIVNTALYYLFVEQEYNMTASPVELREYDQAATLCQSNLETAIKCLPSSLTPDIRNVQALVLLVGCCSLLQSFPPLTSNV